MKRSDVDSRDWALRALYSLGRPAVEGRAIEYTDDIRRLLGHASLEVTFERYIHTLDLITANAIRLVEQRGEAPRVSTGYAAHLASISDRAIRQHFVREERGDPQPGERASTITADQLESLLRSRLMRNS